MNPVTGGATRQAEGVHQDNDKHNPMSKSSAINGGALRHYRKTQAKDKRNFIVCKDYDTKGGSLRLNAVSGDCLPKSDISL